MENGTGLREASSGRLARNALGDTTNRAVAQSARKQAATEQNQRVHLTDFDLIKKIGQGGFGEVYLAKKKFTDEVVAMKIMEKTLIWNKNKVQQIKNERDVLAKGMKGQMVRLLYSFQDPKYLYLAMEYCPGGDLYNLLSQFGRLELHESRRYMCEIILSVSSLHNLGYIHRDLKPDNFLIDANGYLKLGDFGLTKEGARDESPPPNTFVKKGTAAQMYPKGYSVVGSPDFMAPEILLQRPEGYGREVCISQSARAATFSHGCPPFSANTPSEVFDNISSWEEYLPEIYGEVYQVFSEDFFDLLQRFLTYSDIRWGNNLEEIQKHPFFEGIDWANLNSTVPPYFVPQLSDDVDVSYFDNVLKSPEKRSTSFRAYYDRQVLNRRLGGRSTYQRQFSVNQDPFEADTDGENRQIPAWATPMKNRRRLHRSDQQPGSLLITPKKATGDQYLDQVHDYVHDKQILGFTFQRKNTSYSRISAWKNPMPSLSDRLESDPLFEEDEEEERST